MTFKKPQRCQINKPHNLFYNDNRHNCYYMVTEKERKQKDIWLIASSKWRQSSTLLPLGPWPPGGPSNPGKPCNTHKNDWLFLYQGQTKIIWSVAIPLTPVRFLVVWCPTCWTKPNSCQRPEGPDVLQALSPWQRCRWKEDLHSHHPSHGGCRAQEEKRGSSPCQLTLRHMGQVVKITTSRHIFTGMETVSSEIALKSTGRFCSFPGGWRLFDWRRAEWERLRSSQISEMLTQMRPSLLCALLSSLTTFALYRKCLYVLWKETGVKKVCFQQKTVARSTTDVN